MIEDAVRDVVEMSDTHYTISGLAEYIGREMDEIPESVESIIHNMVASGDLMVGMDDDGEEIVMLGAVDE